MVTVTLNETDMATLGSVGLEILAAVPGKVILVKSILLKADCTVKFLTVNPADFLQLSGAVDVNITLGLLGDGRRITYVVQSDLAIAIDDNIVHGTISVNSGINLYTYSGEDFTQGEGTLTITITYEEITI